MFATLRQQASIHTAATIGGALIAATVCANAAEESAHASSWDGDGTSAARLIAAGSNRSAGDYRAGVEIRLAPGWKTYWRYPGDSGVPPRFDFKASDNLTSATVLWPAPHHFGDAAGDTIGYKDNVILPVRLVPRDAAKPVTLRLKLDYAVCEKLCIPAEANAELTLTRQPGREDGRLSAAEARVPKPAKLGDGEALAIRAVTREAANPSRLTVDVATPPQTKAVLFAEGPTLDWALPVPKAVAGAPDGLQRFSFTLDGLPPGVSTKGATLKLTAVAGGTAIEVPVRLD